MTYDTSSFVLEKLYEENLKVIKNVKFTLREAEVASCLLHNRGEKKIASILFISYRTVSVFIRNIKTKLKCNSRDEIIDFIENSGKLDYFKKYYLMLIIECEFKKILIQIGNQINPKPVTYILNNIVVYSINPKILNKFESHLKLANIILIRGEKNENQVKKDLLNIEEDYYNYVFNFIKDFIIHSMDINNLIENFNKESLIRIKQWENNNFSTENLNKPNETNYNIVSLYSFIFIFFIFLTWIILNSDLIIFNNYLATNANPKLISTINEELAKFVNEFSNDNVTKENMSKNQGLIKLVEKNINLLNKKEIHDYFSNIALSSKELLNFLYCLNALSNFYLYNNHDGISARKLLELGQNIVKKYVVNRSKTPFNFDKLDKKEILTELFIIEGLPEIYTQILYFLGRTYLYQGNKEEGIKYFELSRYLGEQIGIFEGFLSIRSGLAIIKEKQINNYIMNKEYDKAKVKINEIINFYKVLKNDNKKYIIGYKPGYKQNKTIIPSQDIYNQVECGEQIIKYFTKLISLTNNLKNKEEYLGEIETQIFSNDGFRGLLSLANETLGKKRASLYNNLGNSLLQFYDVGLNFERLKKRISQELNLKEVSDLEVIYQIFNSAKSESRKTDFTKADAYNGMVKVLTRLINSKNGSLKEEKALSIKILKLIKKRDEININLNRISN